jgi:hypothetical protein
MVWWGAAAGKFHGFNLILGYTAREDHAVLTPGGSYRVSLLSWRRLYADGARAWDAGLAYDFSGLLEWLQLQDVHTWAWTRTGFFLVRNSLNMT